MLTIDIFILAVFVVSIVVGLFRGFFREALSLVTWAAATWVALKYSGAIEPLLASIESTDIRFWAAKILIFILVLVLGGLLNHFINILVAKTGLSGTDRLLGMAFGAIRGALIVGLVIVILRLIGLEDEPWWTESRTIVYCEPVADWMLGYLEEGIEQLQNVVEPPANLADPVVEQ